MRVSQPRPNPLPSPNCHSVDFSFSSSQLTDVGSTRKGREFSSIMVQTGPGNQQLRTSYPRRVSAGPAVSGAPKRLALEAHPKKARGKHLPNVWTSLSSCNLTVCVCVLLQHEPFLKKEQTPSQNLTSPSHGISFSYLFRKGLRAHILLLLKEAGSRVPQLCPGQGSATPPSPGSGPPGRGDEVSGMENRSAQGRDRDAATPTGF